jgi:hypothetical protein
MNSQYKIEKGINEDERYLITEYGKFLVGKGWYRSAGGNCWILHLPNKTFASKTIKGIYKNLNSYFKSETKNTK